MTAILISLFVVIALCYINEGQATFEDINHDLIHYGDESIEVDGFPQGVSDEDKAIINKMMQ